MADSFGMSYAESTLLDGNTIFAEIVPAPLRHLRPWRNRTSRWWFEVTSTQGQTYAYEDGGSDGAFTLYRCMRKAANAVDRIAHREQDRLIAEGKVKPRTPVQASRVIPQI